MSPKFLFLLTAFAGLASALPKIPGNNVLLPICGTRQGPGRDCAKYPDAVEDNLAFYKDDPEHLTWKQCRDTCRSDSRCKSFRYVIQQGDYPYAGISCNHFAVPTAELLVSCDRYSPRIQYLFLLDAWYDAACPSTLPDVLGKPTEKADPFCSMTPKIDMKKFAANTLATRDGDLETFKQEDCRSFCGDMRHCLSYFWGPYAYSERTVLYPNGTRVQSGDDDSHAECVLLGETVRGLNDTMSGNDFVNREQVFDLKCEVPYDGLYD